MAVINAMQAILDGISEKFPTIQIAEVDEHGDSQSAVEMLNWNLSDALQRHIYSAKEQFDAYGLQFSSCFNFKSDCILHQSSLYFCRCVKDLDFNVFRYDGYGKDFIKSCRCSPDGYVQLALQYTYYRYESFKKYDSGACFDFVLYSDSMENYARLTRALQLVDFDKVGWIVFARIRWRCYVGCLR